MAKRAERNRKRALGIYDTTDEDESEIDDSEEEESEIAPDSDDEINRRRDDTGKDWDEEESK